MEDEIVMYPTSKDVNDAVDTQEDRDEQSRET